MWGSLLSGGHATYGGLRTFEPYDGDLKGVQGYYEACRDGKLRCGGHDFNLVHRFFADRNLTLVGLTPNDDAVGETPCGGNARTTNAPGSSILPIPMEPIPRPMM